MISCRLSTILGAKRLKVSDVCRATGIARATMDRYYYDKVNNFDRKVLSKLCDFLQVKPGDLLVLIEQGKLFDTDSEVALNPSVYPVTTETYGEIQTELPKQAESKPENQPKADPLANLVSKLESNPSLRKNLLKAIEKASKLPE